MWAKLHRRDRLLFHRMHTATGVLPRLMAVKIQQFEIIDVKLLAELAKWISCDRCKMRVENVRLRRPRNGAMTVEWTCDKCVNVGQRQAGGESILKPCCRLGKASVRYFRCDTVRYIEKLWYAKFRFSNFFRIVNQNCLWNSLLLFNKFIPTWVDWAFSLLFTDI